MIRTNWKAGVVAAAVVLAAAAILAISSKYGPDAPVPSRSEPAAERSDRVAPAPADPVARPVDALPRDPALIGVRSPAPARTVEAATAVGGAATSTPNFGDRRVLKLYKSLCDALEKAAPPGVELSPRRRWNLSRLEAVVSLIRQERYFYLGRPDSVPPYENTDEVRYFSTQVDGLRLVFEIHRWEFPQVFIKPPLPTERLRARKSG